MFGCEVIFASEDKPITAVGCIFNDGSIYLHEPICDMWASIPDLIEERSDITGFQVIGPVIPVELVKQTMEANFKSAQAFTRKQLAGYKKTYEHDVAQLARFDEYNKKPVSFMNKIEDVA